MKCFYCKQESEWLENKKTRATDYEGRIIIIKNVPCLECPCCGETYYTDEVVEKDQELFEIAKQTMYDYVEMDYEDPAKQVYKLVKVPVHAQEAMGSLVAEAKTEYGK